MIKLLPVFIAIMTSAVVSTCSAQSQRPFLSSLRAGPHTPLYTGYAAAMQRSSFVLDQGYRLNYDTDSLGADFVTEKAGNIGWGVIEDGKWIYQVGKMFQKPIITTSYPDMVEYYYYPFRDVRLDVTMVVHSSDATFWRIVITNESNLDKRITLLPFISDKNGIFKKINSPGKGKILFTHTDIPDGWVKAHHIPYQQNINDLFSISTNPDRIILQKEVLLDSGSLQSNFLGDSARLIAFETEFRLSPKQSDTLRIFRVEQPAGQEANGMINLADSLLYVSPSFYKSANEQLFSKTPLPPFKDSASMYLYWSACNMMRQVFYPPEGNLSHNYYVFSREPHWGWGHGGQVFHESISMLAYAYIDPLSAMNSQRVFAERQHPNGYINYRTGPYLDEVIEEKGQLTSSAPWYSWLNWEVFRITGDTAFLREMYQSSKRFYNFYTTNRDKDHDGLCEWGGEAVLESVRDGLVAVWDQVGYPSEFESVDLNCMLVMEAKSLEKMASVLGLKGEALQWKKDYEKRSILINRTFWDPVNHFYYNVDKRTNTFTYKHKEDLKRDEIIGFLPLWAGVASRQQARYLVRHLTDTASFWRRNGVPSLSAADPYYNPRGYWNGPIWIQWDYLIERGLLDYGYHKVARELVHKVASNMEDVLKSNHELWEFYDPDSTWGGYHRTYVWAGIVNRMMMDLNKNKPQKANK